MELRFTPEEQAFRAEVRDFLKTKLPPSIRQHMGEGKGLAKEEVVTWQRILNAKGWAVPHWPVQWGGQNWTPTQRYILRTEMEAAPAPAPLGFGVNMVGPVIVAFGTEAQKKRYLPRIANLDDWWCQGFSEPGAGSDLASLKTRAKREGDFWIVNGQKTWTTLAQHADWIFCLCRTNPEAKKQEGISFLLIDMKTPGITVRPIITIEGGHEVNEVFFDDVKVPAENLVGEENKGWDCAKYLLSNERTGAARVGVAMERLQRLKRLAKAERDGERPLLEDPSFLARVTQLEVELKAHEMTTLRVLSDEQKRGGRAPNPLSSILKMRGTEIAQAVTELYVELAGPYGLPFKTDQDDRWNEPELGPEWAGRAQPVYFNYRKTSIFGGSNEIQHNILAKAVLGL